MDKDKSKTKLELLAGSGSSPVEMMEQIVSDAEQEGSKVLGIVVFAENDATNDLHTYIGSHGWPRDVDEWPALVDALRRTVEDAKKQNFKDRPRTQVH